MRALCLSLLLGAFAISAVAAGETTESLDPGALLEALGKSAGKLKDAPKRVAQERALLRKRGVPANVEALIPPLRSEAENAAPYYRKLTALLKEKPLTTEQLTTIGSAATTTRPAADVTATAKIISERADITKLIEEATHLPRCSFRRKWALAHDLDFPEFSAMRHAARWLNAEADGLARKGHFDEAIKTQARGFHVAAHAAEEPLIIPSLVAMACSNITLAGMQNLLEQAESLPAEKRLRIYSQIRDAITKNRFKYDPVRSIRGETAWAGDEFRLIRRGGLKALTTASQSRGEPPSTSKYPQTPEEREAWNRWMDAAEVEYLKSMRQLLDIMALPRAQRRTKLQAWDEIDPAVKTDPTQLLRVLMQPMGDSFETVTLRTEGLVDATLAAVAVLDYRALNGRLPESLKEAPAAARPDPFSNGPLRYRRDGEDSFTVYSVGQDGDYQAQRGVRRGGSNVVVWFPRPPVASAAPAPVVK